MSKINSSKDATESRRSPETEDVHKKQKKDPPTFSDPTSLVTFIVGNGGKTKKFIAHREFACNHSKVLDAAFNSNFIEGRTQTYTLEDATEDAFKLFMQWIYSQRLVLGQGDDSREESKERMAKESMAKESMAKESMAKESMDLVELWVLADKLGMPGLQNAALMAINDMSKETNRIPSNVFRYVYENTASDSLLQRYIVAICAMFDPDQFKSMGFKQFPKQMLLDFGVYMLRNFGKFGKEVFKVSDFVVKED